MADLLAKWLNEEINLSQVRISILFNFIIVMVKF